MSALRTFLGASIVVAIGCGGSSSSDVGDAAPGSGDDLTEDGSVGLPGDDGSVATGDSSTGTTGTDDGGPPGANGDAGFRFPFPLDGGFPRRGYPDGGLRPPRRGFDGGIGGFRDAGFPFRPPRDGGGRPPPPPIVDAGNEPG